MREAPAGGVGDVGKILNPPNHIRRAEGRPFPLPSVGWVPVLTVPRHRKPAATARHATMSRRSRSWRPLPVDDATNRPSDCGARPVQSCAGRSVDVSGVRCGDAGVSLGRTSPGALETAAPRSRTRHGRRAMTVSSVCTSADQRRERGDDRRASPPAAAGRSRDGLPSGRGRHCRPRGSRAMP